MESRDGRARSDRWLTVFLFASILGAGALRGESPPPAPGAPGQKLHPLLGSAIAAAASKLASPECQGIFSDFRDASGRTLQENLNSLGQDGLGYLRWTLFYDGSGKRICAAHGILAATSPGSRAVFICMTQFADVSRRDPGLAPALIIHEELHSLGLGENPPDSKEITAAVIARCGR
jgi:hypothetical protein